MERIEYRGVRDRSDWNQGPWDNEPDKIQWPDEATGLPCLIVRSHVGVLCGYVGVTSDHPAFGKQYDEIDVYVHGGLSFADSCAHGDEPGSICHIPGAGEPDNVWWFGFDCGHAWDEAPSRRIPTFGNDTYRDVAYVTEQCQVLAQQLKAMA
jgi:hypothetical protein